MAGFTGASPIVTDGLVFVVDAANYESYPGSGTTWIDLAGNNNGTLTNGPTFDSGNGGSFDFDGADDSVPIDVSNIFPTGNQSHNLSINCWVKLPNTTQQVIFFGSRYGDRLYLMMYQGKWTIGLGGGWQKGVIDATTNWTNICASISNGVATVYVDGISDATRTDTSLSIPSILPIGAYYLDGIWNSGQSFPNSISNVSFYNRSLTASEILQNYNSLKSRFNL